MENQGQLYTTTLRNILTVISYSISAKNGFKIY